MRTQNDIRTELENAVARRGELWEALGHGRDEAKATEAARLSGLIDDLWTELRVVKARQRWGDPELIQRRARAEERLERDSLRIRKAA
jgi:transposase-like protein